MQIFCQKLLTLCIPAFFSDIGSKNKSGMSVNFFLFNFRLLLNCGMSSRLLIHDSFYLSLKDVQQINLDAGHDIRSTPDFPKGRKSMLHIYMPLFQNVKGY